METWEKLLKTPNLLTFEDPEISVVSSPVEDPHYESILRNVRAQMARARVRQIDIIRKYQINKTAISLVLSGKRKTLHIRRAIADELGVPFSQLWSPPRAFHC